MGPGDPFFQELEANQSPVMPGLALFLQATPANEITFVPFDYPLEPGFQRGSLFRDIVPVQTIFHLDP
ncbi:MAG: hypothetical protein A2W72_10205 [Burkholderiales bacterium RIFCSPLOWO2_12_67_14]|nr:MAG: hypothetical protein A2W72_10205 [Burkholderiales bacterium RIFCSPLOWO2_12_67_14]